MVSRGASLHLGRPPLCSEATTGFAAASAANCTSSRTRTCTKMKKANYGISAKETAPVMPSEVTEPMRLEAINNLMKWQHQDPTVKYLIRAVLATRTVPSIGHLARYEPDVFDDLYEEASALVRNDL